jgi:hypothetical protein
MDSVFQIYNLFKRDKKKERFDIILEPLQAITQLALLSFCPKGSKLTISNNLLFIQPPYWGQGLWRSYNQDGKEDLYFLFNAIIRFNKFYSYLQEESEEYSSLFFLLVQLSKAGIDKLLQTYSNTEQPALLHTLQLYRNLLDKPALFSGDDSDIAHLDRGASATTATATASAYATVSKANNINDVFISIRDLYDSHELIILYQTLKLLEKKPEKYDTYINGINTLLSPVHEQIQKWIVDNIVY